jgi:hypothetical protein
VISKVRAAAATEKPDIMVNMRDETAVDDPKRPTR